MTTNEKDKLYESILSEFLEIRVIAEHTVRSRMEHMTQMSEQRHMSEVMTHGIT